MAAPTLDALVQQAAADPAPRAPVDSVDVEPVNAKARRSLYNKREKIYPKLVHGRFRRIKWAVMAVTLAIYYLLPWVRWDRGPGAPDQAVLLDLPNRRFYFFFIEIWPQQIYYLTGLLILAAIGLFLVTSLAGRVWCGYTCPQTVWTDLFVLVERLVEGDRAERIRLEKKPWSTAKIARRVAEARSLAGDRRGHRRRLGFLLRRRADAGGRPARLPGADGVLRLHRPAHLHHLLAGRPHARAGLHVHVPLAAHPGRHARRGVAGGDLPRLARRAARSTAQGRHRGTGNGDCIDCKQCVVACPMGIDIRDGQQLECITCALCIDACDDVMTRIGKPTGLIAYDTLGNLERRSKGEPARLRLLRPRTLFYAAVLVVVSGFMAFSLGTRSELEINVINDRNPLYVTLSDGAIRNGYTLKILNMANEPRHFALSLEGLPQATLTLGGKLQAGDIVVPADEVLTLRLFVAAPPDALGGPATEIAFVLQADGESHRHASVFRGPER